MRDMFFVLRIDKQNEVWVIDFASPHEDECEEFIRSTNSLRALRGKELINYDVVTLVKEPA